MHEQKLGPAPLNLKRYERNRGVTVFTELFVQERGDDGISAVLLVPKTYSRPCEALALCVLHTREEKMPQQDAYSPQLTLAGAVAHFPLS